LQENLESIKVEHDDDDDDDHDDDGPHALTFVAENGSIDTRKDECFTPFESCIKMIEVEVRHVVSLCVC
jgi:hypothetical protein